LVELIVTTLIAYEDSRVLAQTFTASVPGVCAHGTVHGILYECAGRMR